MSEAGQPIDPAGFPVFDRPVIPEIQPAIAARPEIQSALFTGAVFHPEAPYGTYRITLRVAEPLTSGVAEETATTRPFSVSALPNPSWGPVALSLEAPAAARVEVVVVNAAGREVRRLAAQPPAGGERVSVVWDGRDANGRDAPRGVYFARIRAGGAERAVKLVRR